MLYADDDAERDKERADADERLARIEEKLAAAKTDQGEEGGMGTPPSTGPDVVEKPKPSKPLLIAGGVLTGVGVAGLAVGFAGMGMGAAANDVSGVEDDPEKRGDQFSRGRSANVMAIVGSVAGGVLVVTGVALIGIGAKRKKDAKQMARRPMVVPMVGRTNGLALTGRF
jgi:hypothetical protein